MADLVRRCSRPGEVILDPFCGAGTTGVVAVDLGRRFVGADIDEQALATAATRLVGAAKLPEAADSAA
jgi:DNA modification methylase